MDTIGWMTKMQCLKKEMCELDSEKLYRYYPPNTGCTMGEIDTTEKLLNIKLDKQYAEFLQQANGWKQFYRYIDLFGTSELNSSKEMDMAREILEIVCPLDEKLEFKEHELLPIAIDEYGSDLFVLTPSQNGENGKVIWFAGQEIERFNSFEEFMNTILQYIKNELNRYFKDNRRDDN